jgi:hypothetical protein
MVVFLTREPIAELAQRSGSLGRADVLWYILKKRARRRGSLVVSTRNQSISRREILAKQPG